MKRFKGKVAVITGAASGIGRATALRLADRGCALALADVNEAGLDDLVKTLAESKSAAHREAFVSTHCVDVASATAMEAFAGEVEDIHSAAHLLINNAGVVVATTFEDQSLADLEWMVGINYWGVVYGCHAFLPLLKRQDEAHIVNLSSMFGFLGLPLQSGYCATKAAVRALSESLYVELRSSNIGVSSIHPGCIDTSIVRSGRMHEDDLRSDTQALFDRLGAPPDVVAQAIIKAIEKKQLRARVRPESVATDVLKRLIPVTIHRFLAWRWERDQARQADQARLIANEEPDQGSSRDA
jgi:NAD(P)-dependent dehydrogenase (short-subunit alcohol dehydrogenase family)